MDQGIRGHGCQSTSCLWHACFMVSSLRLLHQFWCESHAWGMHKQHNGRRPPFLCTLSLSLSLPPACQPLSVSPGWLAGCLSLSPCLSLSLSLSRSLCVPVFLFFARTCMLSLASEVSVDWVATVANMNSADTLTLARTMRCGCLS